MRSSTRHAVNLRRALGGVLAALASAFAFGFLIAPAARATPLPPSLSPLPGSSFQGADGNQGDAQPALDWQAFQAAGRVHHSPDPSAQDSAFTAGSKEDEPGLWDLTTEPGGVNPAKANILDAWSSFDPQGGEAFLYLGFAREAASLLAGRRRPRAATTFITFELNHDPRVWDNGHATIPCRSTGDVLVSYEAQGNYVSVVLQRWVTTQTDAASGCATTGHLDDVHRPHAEYGRSGRGQRDGYSYVPARRVHQHDPQRALRRDGAEPRPGPRARGRRTAASPSARSGCTRAPPRPIPRTCRTTSRRSRSPCGAARHRGRSSTISTRTVDATPASRDCLVGRSGPTTTTTACATPTSRSRSPTAKASTSSTTSARPTARTRCGRRC